MCTFMVCGSIPLLSANKKYKYMEQLIVKIVLRGGETYVFNFSYVRNFSFNKEEKTAKVTIIGRNGEYKAKIFSDVTELVLRKAYE